MLEITLKEAKIELKNSWLGKEECYDYDQMFVVCYKDGTVLDTRETNTRLPLTGIIGIQFFGSDATYSVGHEVHNGIKIAL